MYERVSGRVGAVHPPEMAMSPFALSILGLESTNRRRRRAEGETDGVRGVPGSRATRSSRRATSHYNVFQTVCTPANDSPPSYAIATSHRPSPREAAVGGEVLPGYTCTIDAEAKVLLQLESVNPLHVLSESEWRETYLVLRGTLLSFHRVKDDGPGKLLRSYTLQHAEIGLAADTSHTVLVPQSRLAHLIPVSARRRAWQKDPDLFKPVRQTVLRLRAETDQILLADSSEEHVHELIHAISASIDISHAIDERAVPRQCTVPRRRRRQRPRMDGDLTDPALLAEQERILREMYPAFAERAALTRPDLQRTTTEEVQREQVQAQAREEDDLDLSVMREDFASPNTPAPTQSMSSSQRPAMSRQTTASSVNSAFSDNMVYATSPANFNAAGKWQPPHPRTAAQVQRYARRCMPVLLAESVRASDVIICNGKRVKINWRMELLEEWELQPPSYRSHKFDSAPTNLERSKSQSSAAPSATQTSPQSSRSLLAVNADQIEPIDAGLANLELSKADTPAAGDKRSSPHPHPRETQRSADVKVPEIRYPGTEIHGVVFCF